MGESVRHKYMNDDEERGLLLIDGKGNGISRNHGNGGIGKEKWKGTGQEGFKGRGNKDSDEELEREIYNTKASFKLLFVEIGDWPRTAQFTFVVTCMFSFLLLYGFLQEYIAINLFNRKLGLFLTLAQFVFNSTLAILQRRVNGDRERKIPLKAYLILAALQASNQGFTNLSMKYLNYPVKSLFKSSRVVPTVLVGACLMRKKYHVRDYMVVIILTLGLCLFMKADMETSPAYHPLGILFILMAVAADGATVNLQEYYLRRYDASHDELVAYSYAIGSIFLLFVTTIVTDDLYSGVIFLSTHGSKALLAIFFFCFSGYIGVTCATALTKRFGALLSAITTTVRKAMTVFLSFIIFPKPFTANHCTGGLLFLLGLIWKTYSSYSTATNKSIQSPARTQSNPIHQGIVGNEITGKNENDDSKAVRHRHSSSIEVQHNHQQQQHHHHHQEQRQENQPQQLHQQYNSSPLRQTNSSKSSKIAPMFSSYLPSIPSVTSFPNFSVLGGSITPTKTNSSPTKKFHQSTPTTKT